MEKVPPPKAVVLGEAALVIMKYKGFQEGRPYHGLVTGTAYHFGMTRMRGFVDSRDVPSMQEIVEDTQWVFEIE